MLDKQRIKDDADMLVVAESLGINLVRKGTNYQCLCPFHADKHIGSCYINNKRLHCYSCNTQADVFKLVMQINGCDFETSVRYVADLCGGESLYEGSAKDLDSSGFMPKSIQEKLGIDNTPIKILQETTEDTEYASAQRTEGKEVDTDPESGCYMIYSMIDANPLYTLFKENPEAYRDLIDEKVIERIDALESILQYDQVQPNSEDSKAYISLCKKLSNISGKILLSEVIQKMTSDLEEISLKYGNGKAISNKNIFVSTVADSIWDQEGAF